MRSSARALSIAVLAISFALAPVSAGANVASPDPVVPDATSDALQYEYDISSERAANIVQAQESFSHLVAELEELEVTYAGSAIDPTTDYDAWVSFVGLPSAEAIELISGVPLDIDLRTDARFTAAELRESLREAHAALEAEAGIGGAAGYLDTAAQKLVFAAWPDESATLSRARADVADVAADTSGPQIEIVTVPESVVSDEINGGAHLSNGCTSAFNVRDGSGRKGFLTAAHCPNPVSGYPFVKERETAGFDVQLHRATSVTNLIRVSSGGTTRTITGWYYPSGGGTACNYGRSTGNKCTTIFSNDVCWPGLGCGFYATNAGVTSGGDSGGPWYSGNSALGVHKGTMWLFGNKSVFTDMGNALSAMSVSLCRTSTC
ncbi:streptogrisin C [Microbacterium sp. SORGH_AS 505]|uniref:S1 family peptidase n=1 Tax=Microbacterium sp. SORGH_AS_0505 TaxID=3041770 RepID=UPI002787523C|nr:S1 family peptidase [Microbacterium sp. SORGH_AS_0505]MDQ1126228.1 streptogrisin C [Microbacterium sp. SORGH_AS_0505]